jgi:hypothetical protein
VVIKSEATIRRDQPIFNGSKSLQIFGLNTLQQLIFYTIVHPEEFFKKFSTISIYNLAHFIGCRPSEVIDAINPDFLDRISEYTLGDLKIKKAAVDAALIESATSPKGSRDRMTYYRLIGVLDGQAVGLDGNKKPASREEKLSLISKYVNLLRDTQLKKESANVRPSRAVSESRGDDSGTSSGVSDTPKEDVGGAATAGA